MTRLGVNFRLRSDICLNFDYQKMISGVINQPGSTPLGCTLGAFARALPCFALPVDSVQRSRRCPKPLSRSCRGARSSPSRAAGALG